MGDDRGETGTTLTERTIWWFPSGGMLSHCEGMTPDALAGVRVRPFAPFQAGALIAALWDEPRRRAGAKKSLLALLDASGPLLHVIQDGSVAFQWALLDAATRAGYLHRVVSLRTPLNSLRMAAHESRWNGEDCSLPPLLREHQDRQNRLAYLLRLMREGRHQWELVAPDTSDESWLVDLPQAVGKGLRQGAKVAQQLMGEAQEQLLTIEAGWLAGPEQPPALLRPSLVRPSVEDPRVKFARLEGIPPLLPRGERVQTHGAVIFDSTAPSQLELEQAGASEVLTWPCPSPALASKWPDCPAAHQARFSSGCLVADAKSPAHLRLRSNQSELVPVLDVQFKEDPTPAVKGIFLARWSIGYQSIPKVACTSLKEALFRLATGQDFDARKRPGAVYVHEYFGQREQDITHADWRFVVVRDPIQRFLSGFSNRVLHYRELSRNYLAQQPSMAGVDLESFPVNPGIEQFIANFEFYCRVPTIRHHFSPISTFVAPLDSFSRVYAFHEINVLAADISERTKHEFVISHSQQGGPKLTLDHLKPESLRKLIRIYEADYEMLKHIYQSPSL